MVFGVWKASHLLGGDAVRWFSEADDSPTLSILNAGVKWTSSNCSSRRPDIMATLSTHNQIVNKIHIHAGKWQHITIWNWILPPQSCKMQTLWSPNNIQPLRRHSIFDQSINQKNFIAWSIRNWRDFLHIYFTILSYFKADNNPKIDRFFPHFHFIRSF